jgi:light-harvesting complex I chlorophyll a/b binding protein 4
LLNPSSTIAFLELRCSDYEKDWNHGNEPSLFLDCKYSFAFFVPDQFDLGLTLLDCLNCYRAAFAPISKKTSGSALAAWKDETVVGIVAPTGFFDPLGLSKGKSDEVMAHYREAELKNGRVAMAACLGWYITAAGVHPAFNSALSSDPLAAAKELPMVGWIQFVLGCGAIEWMAEQIKKRPGYVPGDVLGASYWVDDSDEGWVDYQNKELSNGRLAMVAIMGIIGKSR